MLLWCCSIFHNIPVTLYGHLVFADLFLHYVFFKSESQKVTAVWVCHGNSKLLTWGSVDEHLSEGGAFTDRVDQPRTCETVFETVLWMRAELNLCHALSLAPAVTVVTADSALWREAGEERAPPVDWLQCFFFCVPSLELLPVCVASCWPTWPPLSGSAVETGPPCC